MDYHVEEPNLAVTGIPTALEKIWGRNRNHGVLERIAHSVATRGRSDVQMVDICVNLGIKPRVHYQSEYPCDAIADLFEAYVGMLARREA